MQNEAALTPFPRQSTTRLVMEHVLRRGPISRAEIARSSGLSKQTISEVVRELEADGWIMVDGQVQGTAGRSATTYSVRAEGAFVLGIDLGGTKLHIALADLKGNVVMEGNEPTSQGGGPAVIEQIGRMADVLVEDGRIDRTRLLAATMGSPGIVDPSTGGIAIAPNIPGIDSLDVREALRQRLGCEVLLENDVNLAATGEHWRGNSRRARTFAFVAIGTGIGMGLFADGRLVRGHRGAAGEIAYLPLGGDAFDTRGHRLGTLETAVGSAAIVGRYQAAGGRPGATVRDVFDRLDLEPAARAALDETARVIALAVVAIHSIADPEVVVLGGSIGARPEMRNAIESYLARCMAEPVPLEISALGNLATLYGAIGSAIDLLHRILFGLGATTTSPALPVIAADAP
jgi:predicted NBD/HSP70 family sugar kinase